MGNQQSNTKLQQRTAAKDPHETDDRPNDHDQVESLQARYAVCDRHCAIVAATEKQTGGNVGQKQNARLSIQRKPCVAWGIAMFSENEKFETKNA
jgi:hypothetical protein